MELVWEDPPVPEGPFFTRDAYDKYSLKPNIRELWAFLQSPAENTNINNKGGVSAAKTSCSTSTDETAECKDSSYISKEDSCLDSCDGEDTCAENAAPATDHCKDVKTTKVTVQQAQNEADEAFPEPRLPYPCMSSLTSKDQKTYLDCLTSKKPRDPPQALQVRVNNEVMQFTKYLQDVAKVCADDYLFIPPGALQYTEDFFRCCLECIKSYPQLYQIHEMTSLTGGTFNPGLELTFEKQLLIMGNVDITCHRVAPVYAQLASDYQSVSSEHPPAKKAKDMHARISTDNNAKSLSDRYEPHVCLTRDALFRLLDNHGPDFGESWELPVLVKCNQGKGSSLKKTVYVDCPLLKTGMIMRERSHFFHEESLKLSFNKNGSKNVFHVLTELPASEKQLSPDMSRRDVVSFENEGLDFDVDLTDLETFGETPVKSSKMQKIQSKQDLCVKNDSSPLSRNKRLADHPATGSSSQEEVKTCLTPNIDHPAVVRTQPVTCGVTEPKTELQRPDCAQESDEDLFFAEDSDDSEKLVIDDLSPQAATQKPQTKPKTTPDSHIPPVSEPLTSGSQSPSPQKVTKQRRQAKRAKVSGDQLGEILRMQEAMFHTSSDTAKHSSMSQEIMSPTRCTGPQVHSHPTSLVKPCVSSYLERSQNQDRETFTTASESAGTSIAAMEHKKLLSEDLQAGAEDERDYEPPEEGNLIYKLYCLQDLLLMVRSSISLTYTHRVGTQNEFVPVFVLPKMEYQLSYGVECQTSSEACQLWTEKMLHSSTDFYKAHINACTSKVALLRKLPADAWKQNSSCGFKPAKSLNILHHLLKKLTGLDEGQYLITHEAGKPFVTLLKAVDGKVSRGAYNLQQIHSSVPQPPSSSHVPWIPVDPSLPMSFHKKHGRVPCTFPPKPFTQTANSHGAGQMNSNMNAGGNKKKRKQKKRAAKRQSEEESDL